MEGKDTSIHRNLPWPTLVVLPSPAASRIFGGKLLTFWGPSGPLSVTVSARIAFALLPVGVLQCWQYWHIVILGRIPQNIVSAAQRKLGLCSISNIRL